MPFTFNNSAYIVKLHCSQKKREHKCQLTEFVSVTKLMNWPKDSRKDKNYYINEGATYKLLFSSQQPRAKIFRKYCSNMMFPYI